ncbi:hypothetical protein WJX79_004935 [Trebouxia sp. C0005]
MALVALKLDDLGKGWRDHGVDSPVIPLINADNSQCLHWCGWNSAVQLLAGFPGLLATVHTAAKDGNLKEMSSRREGGRLIEDVACFELLQMLCGALHNEFMNVFQRAIPDLPEAASYWASMMSTVQHTRQMCHSGRKRCKNIGNRENQQYQAVSVRTAALLHDGGMGQLLCSVLGHYMFVRTECGFCSKGRKKGPAEKSVTEQFVRLPVMLLVSVYSQQTHSAGTDINDAVSLHLQQCVELEEWNSHDWSRHMAPSTGFGPHKVAAEDEPTSDSGLLFSRWGQDAEAATQAGLLNAKAHTSVDCTVGLPSRDVAAVQAGPLCRADSSDAPVPTQPASAVPLLSDQSETVHGKGHNGLPNSHGGASMVQADLLQGSGMIGEARAVCSDVPGLDRAAGQLPQPNEDRPSSGNAQEQAGVAIGMSRADSSDDSVPAQPASAGPLLPHEVETADGQGHGPMGGVLAQSPALASGRSSTAEAAQSAAAIIDVFGATLHNASGHAAEPHASSAASTVTLPAPAGAQAQGEVPDRGHRLDS